MKQKNDFEKWYKSIFRDTPVENCISEMAWQASQENTAKKILEILDKHDSPDYYDYNEEEINLMIRENIKKEFLGEGNE